MTPTRARRRRRAPTRQAPAKSDRQQTVLVTGGTGFLGALVRRRARSKRATRARARARAKSAALAERGVEIVVGDVARDLDGDRAAGARVRRRVGAVPPRRLRLARSRRRPAHDARAHRRHAPRARSRQGGRRAPRGAGVDVGHHRACRRSADILDESAPYPTEIVGGWPYYLSKIYQEKLALELGATLGLEIVVVNPSLLLGPGDERGVVDRRRAPVPEARDPGGARRRRQLRRRARRGARHRRRARARPRRRALPPRRAQLDRRRILRAPRARVEGPRAPAQAAERAAAARPPRSLEHAYKALDKEPPVERISVEMAQVYWWCDSGKAERELGFVGARSAARRSTTPSATCARA